MIDCASDALNSMVLDTKHSDFSLLHIGQLLTCELPLSLAYWFPRIDVFCEMGQRGTAALSESIIELLDGEGVPHARHLPYLPLLFACWTRCVYLDSFGPGNRIDRDARLQFEWLVRQTLRFRRADGQLVLTQCDTPARLISDMISAAMAIAGDDLDRDIQSAALPKSKLPVIHHLPAAGEHSAWAEVAVLRTDWTTSAAICAIDFCRECPSIELAVGKKLIAQGQDMPTVQVNGQMAAVRQPWEEICWESDDDVDYVELEAVLQHGLVLQRQYALFRDEMLLFTADAILGATQTDIEYERRLPFVDGISLSAKEETRELTMELGT
ncbi:MAG: hypothetical protein KDA51_04835, partial [Planctomycetales bacterium]|nr:hypothetical protein [Planctomycetales bacterium]